MCLGGVSCIFFLGCTCDDVPVRVSQFFSLALVLMVTSLLARLDRINRVRGLMWLLPFSMRAYSYLAFVQVNTDNSILDRLPGWRGMSIRS